MATKKVHKKVTKLKLQPFQTKLLKGINKTLEKEKKVILAATTGAGKTEILIKFIEANPNKRFLILAHGQRTIRENFADRLHERGFKCVQMQTSRDYQEANDNKIVVALPMNIHRILKKLKNFDYLIVDEAHQYYGQNKGMYSRILSWHNTGRQILATASHYDLEGSRVCFSREEALETGRVVDALFSLRGVKGQVFQGGSGQRSQFTNTGDLRESVELTATSYSKVLELLNKQRKTMIVCHNTVFAYRLKKQMISKGYNVGLSDSITDVNSDNIKKFKNNEIKMLIVVMRGNIGFDCPNLEHIIDASYTKNIKRMEQLLGRVTRKDKGKAKKYYDKLIPQNLFQEYLIYTTGVLALGLTDVYSSWTGKHGDLPVKLPTDGLVRPRAVVDNVLISKFTVNSHYQTSFGKYVSSMKQPKRNLVEMTVKSATDCLKGSGRLSDELLKKAVMEYVKSAGKRAKR